MTRFPEVPPALARHIRQVMFAAEDTPAMALAIGIAAKRASVEERLARGESEAAA